MTAHTASPGSLIDVSFKLPILADLTAKPLWKPSPHSYLWVLTENRWENGVQNQVSWFSVLCFKWRTTFSQGGKKNDPKVTLALLLPESMELQQFIVMRFLQVYYSDRKEQLGNLLRLIQTANQGSEFYYFEEISGTSPPPTSFFSSWWFCQGLPLLRRSPSLPCLFSPKQRHGKNAKIH